jgi:hypothetical protein
MECLSVRASWIMWTNIAGGHVRRITEKIMLSKPKFLNDINRDSDRKGWKADIASNGYGALARRDG